MNPQNDSRTVLFDGLTQEEIGNLVKYATCKIKLKQKKLSDKGITVDQLSLMETGEWTEKTEYIIVLSMILRRLIPLKVKLKNIPEQLPSRKKIESMMRGETGSIMEFKNLILALFRMPDLPPKTRTVNIRDTRWIKNEKIWGNTPRTIIKRNRTGWHPDFEYGITDT